MKDHITIQAQKTEAELEELIEALCTIPAPLGQEWARAEFVQDWLNGNGLTGSWIDRSGNVIFPYSCNSEKYIAFTAHMDTVFPETEPFPFVREGTIAKCPGIGDDTANMAALMLAARWVVQQRLCFPYSLLFVWDTGEEGLGNLNGVRGLMEDYADRIAALVALDGVYPGLIDGAVGSVRWRIRAKTSGGHSFRNFGSPNAIERMAALIGALYAQPLPDAEGARTTFNVGSIAGGTSVNTIAQACEILYEVRSDSAAALNAMECALNALVRDAQQRGGVDFSCEEIGLRPASGARAEGQDALESHWKRAVQAVLPGQEVRCTSGSTDCNIPLSMAIPAMCVGAYRGGAAHTREEWIDCASLSTGYALLLHLFHSFAQEDQQFL